MSRKPPETEEFGQCRLCREQFLYRTSTGVQTVCRQCYFERRDDYTGAIQEREWKMAYRLGAAEANEPRDNLAEQIAKLVEFLPIRDLIALCHPDRHPEERQLQAHRATTQLLDLKRILEGAESRVA